MIGPAEIAIICVIAALCLGTGRVRDAGNDAITALKDFRKAMKDSGDE